MKSRGKRPGYAKPSPERSATMRAVKSRDTGPELIVRRLAHELAPGYRLCRADLPGKPDIAYGPRKLAIFVHGCFWHGHDCPRGARMPKTNRPYWADKIGRSCARDIANEKALEALGWRALTIYECELKDRDTLAHKLGAALACQH